MRVVSTCFCRSERKEREYKASNRCCKSLVVSAFWKVDEGRKRFFPPSESRTLAVAEFSSRLFPGIADESYLNSCVRVLIKGLTQLFLQRTRVGLQWFTSCQDRLMLVSILKSPSHCERAQWKYISNYYYASPMYWKFTEMVQKTIMSVFYV